MVFCWMFDDGDDSGNHEPCGANGSSRPRDLSHFDGPTDVGYFDSPTGAGSRNLKPFDACSNVDEDLYAITSHGYRVASAAPEGHLLFRVCESMGKFGHAIERRSDARSNQTTRRSRTPLDPGLTRTLSLYLCQWLV